MRALLKRQIREKWEGQRQALASRMREVEAVREADRLVLNQDLEQNRTRARALTVFRDENKRVREREGRVRVATCPSFEKGVLRFQYAFLGHKKILFFKNLNLTHLCICKSLLKILIVWSLTMFIQ